MTALLTVQDVKKRFRQTQALDGAGLKLEAGEWLGLLGPNGAGKTTLVRAIAGRVRLDGGEMTLLGKRLDGNASEAAAVRQQLGIVPQELAIYPLLTAVENLQAFGRLHSVSAAELKRRIPWALEWTGLADRAREKTKNFSGGMKRRLNIACGVLHRPTVVLLDEPTVGVDPQSRERIWEMLGQLRQDGASLLLTTHQLDEAERVCDRIAIIDRGRTIADGTLAELIAHTVGSKRKVTLTLDQTPAPGVLDNGAVADGRILTLAVDDVATELPALLSRVRDAGHQVEDIHIETASLQAVFIHLTGRELRE